MKLYCTAGKGIEKFAAEEIRQTFRDAIEEVNISTGKIFFELKHFNSNTLNLLMGLKAVERIFVEAIKEPVENFDKRSLLTQLHTSLNNKQAWEQCLQILQKCPKSSQKASPSPKTEDNFTEPTIKKSKTDNAHEATTFRVSCKLAGRPKLKLNAQRTSMQMAFLISKLLGWKADPRYAQYEINIHLNDTALVVGMPLISEPLSRRVYFRHCGLRSTVAVVMGRVVEIQPGDVVLDSMCGMASILIEAGRQHRSFRNHLGVKTSELPNHFYKRLADCDKGLYALHHVYLRRINELLELWLYAWINLRIHTVKSTPVQLFIAGLLNNPAADPISSNQDLNQSVGTNADKSNAEDRPEHGPLFAFPSLNLGTDCLTLLEEECPWEWVFGIYVYVKAWHII